jgi:hypothetical protein
MYYAYNKNYRSFRNNFLFDPRSQSTSIFRANKILSLGSDYIITIILNECLKKEKRYNNFRIQDIQSPCLKFKKKYTSLKLLLQAFSD